MASKQARDLKPGDVTPRGTVRTVETYAAHLLNGGAAPWVVVTWSDGTTTHIAAWERVTVEHVSTIGGAL